jgi:hypothetical protein
MTERNDKCDVYFIVLVIAVSKIFVRSFIFVFIPVTWICISSDINDDVLAQFEMVCSFRICIK